MMEAMRESWTDHRMDDLNAKVDELGRGMDNGFNRVNADIRALRAETKTEFGAVRGEMKAESAAQRNEIKTESAAFREEAKSQSAALRNEMKTESLALRKEVRTESAAFRNEVKTEAAAFRGEVNERFEGMQDRLDAIQRTMLWFCGLAMTALVGLIAALLGAVIPQL